ncbi:hypothetical protein CU086_00450 [Candidatus Nasuia deltocephalinicola]|uniref:Uncharacterized protein n=1 Tax=Candidatus Nasuia deltocephalincola TaxID=1160784 RepID=A0A974WL37_9PROT|nr:hypothetical protein CU086_00450 [Candidatus Nasuia deltocephalinicola]
MLHLLIFIIFSKLKFSINKIMKICTLISGGIDSLFLTIILKLLNYKILGIHILNWNYYNKNNIFKIINIFSKLLNFKIIIVDFKLIYKKLIFLKFIKNYLKNYLINIDLLCNKIIKFKLILKFLKKKIKLKN